VACMAKDTGFIAEPESATMMMVTWLSNFNIIPGQPR